MAKKPALYNSFKKNHRLKPLFPFMLEIDLWTKRAACHSAQVSPLADAFIQRRSIGAVHPVDDFLFTYYNCSPLKLKQWMPSCEELLVIEPEIRERYPWLNSYWLKLEGNLLSLDCARMPKNLFGLADFVKRLSANILARPPRFKCLGLHEWAMVYKASEIKHQGYTLRLSSKALAEFVESQVICCSHYDAYRFFTPPAKPLNTLNPQLDTRLDMEQGGCLHANMDLYKWSIKLWPWIGSDFMGRAFLLASEIRQLDMRASPYDLSCHGYAPLCIETKQGQEEYCSEQQRFAERATLLRKELHAFCERLLQDKSKDFPC